MKILATISDVRNFRQLGKQVNSDSFNARIKEVQDNELTELLGRSLAYDFFNFLDTGFSQQAGTFVRNSDYQFTATAIDLSSWVGASLRINSDTFMLVESATFGGTDTIITVTGYKLPTTLDLIEYSAENKYIKLLNGSTYSDDGHNVNFNGLRPFISWKFLAIYITDANVKHSDVGNFSITSDNFQKPSRAEIEAAKSTYLSNSAREYNNIVDYLNENSSNFPLWESKGNENIESFNFVVV